jgi:hypothetical protein
LSSPQWQPKREATTEPVAIPVNVDLDQDSVFQGNYAGGTLTGKLGHEDAGLRVTSLGSGKFRAVQYRQGLPGQGWNGADSFALMGRRVGDTLQLAANGQYGTYTIIIRDGLAQLRNAGGQSVGSLQKVDPGQIVMEAAGDEQGEQAALRAAAARR